jgi:hypothetical protein
VLLLLQCGGTLSANRLLYSKLEAPGCGFITVPSVRLTQVKRRRARRDGNYGYRSPVQVHERIMSEWGRKRRREVREGARRRQAAARGFEKISGPREFPGLTLCSSTPPDLAPVLTRAKVTYTCTGRD